MQHEGWEPPAGYDLRTSDGCTSPLGKWMEANWPRALRCCHEHDAAYWLGGTSRDRLVTDVRFLLCLLVRGVDAFVACRAYDAVRLFGAPHYAIREAPDAPESPPAVMDQQSA